MKLPDFLVSPALNRLRERMDHAPLGNFVSVPGQTLLSAADLQSLSGEGLEVASDEVEVLPDSTLAYRGRRVLLYIRESHLAARGELLLRTSGNDTLPEGEESLPRFHVAHCRTLEAMRYSGRSHRYVVATREDGLFDLVLYGRPVRRRLRVCKNCLETLDWKGFSSRPGAKDRSQAVQDFRIDEFFRGFGNTVAS